MLLVGADDDGPVVPGPGPHWEAVNEAGQVLNSSALAGKPYAVEFWSTRCGPCVASLPELNRFVQSEAQRGVPVIGITSDTPGMVNDFQATHTLAFPVAFDPDFKLGNAFQAPGLPAMAVVDAQGRVVYRQAPPDYDRIAQVIDRLTGKH